MDSNGHKEVKEAVLIGALVAIAGQLIVWGFDEIKTAVNNKRRDTAAQARKDAAKKRKEDGDSE